ncbi:tetraacyldisaccharide 4'-kinase [Methylovorus sp. MP688]|uniref:tetraacyldisaccharide 4'-kinase n=1 Tax=Methylovorus sp. (strain MP688) TaxID=887061 RepID=UPI0001EC4495|nr:tetraacyldisaccharide 4'-kinase [Methylovorus sp. MP688]ADQ83848.1 tetraacyldisaccharide 4'-kinase [Methylovorus sp. MP688]
MKAKLATFIQQQWTRTGVWHLLLIPLSWLFAALSSLRRLAYQYSLLPSFRLPVPVIVVGNISVGGTGKTPLVIWLVKQLQAAGFHPLIVSRGYAAYADVVDIRQVQPGSDPAIVGDEPLLMAQRTQVPVWIGRERAKVAQAALANSPECNVIVSDDGLQHYALQRDIEIAVVDAARLFGNRRLLPAGPLREPVARLSEVDAVVMNGANGDEDGFYMQLVSHELYNLKSPASTCALKVFEGQAVHAVAGIGNPQRFFAQLKSAGLEVIEHPFPDHHAFEASQLAFCDDVPVIMTEKDAVKCAAFAQPNWWVMPVEAELSPAFLPHVLSKLGV